MDKNTIVNNVKKGVGSIGHVENLTIDLGKDLEKYIPKNYTPPLLTEKYFERDNEQEIIDKLLEKKVLQIYGVSGLGKSEVSKSISQKIKDDFELVIWINYNNIDVLNFESINISNFQDNINLKTILENDKVLLILDNFNKNLKDIKNQFSRYNQKESICLITSLDRTLSKSNSYELDYLSKEISKNIIFETDIKPSDDIANEIIEYINGYPLLLNIIRDSVEEEEDTWEDILDDLKNVVSKEDFDKGKKVSKRILERHLNSIGDNLEWIYLLDTRFISKEFFQFCTSKSDIKDRLIRKSIIADTESSFYTVHQIILDSIIDIFKDKINIDKAYKKIEDFLSLENEKKSVGYFNFLFRHTDFMDKIYNSLDNSSPLKKQILYSKTQARNANDDTWFLEEIEKYNLNFDLKINFLLIVEKIEIELFQAKKEFKESDNEKYIEICKSKIEKLEKLKDSYKTQNITFYLNHHLGKIYSRIGEYIIAKELFEEVLKVDSNADYAKLQIARILVWDKENDNSEQLKSFFNDLLVNIKNWEKQSLSVLLAVYELLSNNNMKKFRKIFIDDTIDDFRNRLFYSLSFGFEQPYQLLARLSSHLSYNQKSVYSEICENLPFPSTIDSNDKVKYAYATIQVAYYKNLKYSQDIDKQMKMDIAFNIAKDYYESIDLEDIQRGKFVDLYIESQKYSEAFNEIEKYKEKEDSFYLQKICKIYRGLEKYKDSSDAINKAMNILEKKDEKFYLSAFLNDKAETLYADGDQKSAISVLEEAIEKQSYDNTKKSWNNKLNKWKE